MGVENHTATLAGISSVAYALAPMHISATDIYFCWLVDHFTASDKWHRYYHFDVPSKFWGTDML
jgi:hypothetical protein